MININFNLAGIFSNCFGVNKSNTNIPKINIDEIKQMNMNALQKISLICHKKLGDYNVIFINCLEGKKLSSIYSVGVEFNKGQVYSHLSVYPIYQGNTIIGNIGFGRCKYKKIPEDLEIVLTYLAELITQINRKTRNNAK